MIIDRSAVDLDDPYADLEEMIDKLDLAGAACRVPPAELPGSLCTLTMGFCDPPLVLESGGASSTSPR